MNQVAILRRPLITEKSSKKDTEVAFEVDRSATKSQVKAAVETAFKVKVMRVNTLVVPGKLKRTGRNRRHQTRTHLWKKAIVGLKPGDKIELFETKKT